MAMEVKTACTIINEQIVFAPGWVITAEPFTHRFENGVKVNVKYPACATERVEAEEGYPRLIETGAAFIVCLACDNEMTLLRQLLEEVIFPIQQHEAREMLRLKPTFWAPFHPHKIGGMSAWGDVQSDRMFGLA